MPAARVSSWCLVLCALAGVATSACTTVRITATSRSSVEQRLLARSIERSVARLDTSPLDGRRVRVELFSLSGDAGFAEEYVRSLLEHRGVRVARHGEPADVALRIFSRAIAVDTSETLLGLPTMQVPVIGFPTPEIALFKLERSRGHAEIDLFAYDGDGRFVRRLAGSLGEARYDRYTILIVVSFSVTDVGDAPEPAPAPPASGR